MTSTTRSSAQARASRRNGAKSRGPVSAKGRARSAQNALKHGLRARTVTLLSDEDAGAFEALDGAIRAELAPSGALQNELVDRIVLAAWRARRADRMEGELFVHHLDAGAAGTSGLGTALIRDAHGPRVVETLLRYRGSVHAEFFRALGALRVLQGKAGEDGDPPVQRPATKRTRADAPVRHDQTNPR